MDNEELIKILKEYVSPKLYKICNFDKIIKNSKEKDGIIKFDFHVFNLYLKKDDYSYVDAEPKFK